MKKLNAVLSYFFMLGAGAFLVALCVTLLKVY